MIEFDKWRTHAHIAAVNMFADLIGMRFPHHDADKFTDPILIPYAFKNYAEHHSEFKFTAEMRAAFDRAHDAHHHTAAHHPESYENIADMPDVAIAEMVCDWVAASMEQNLILCDSEYPKLMDFYTQYALPVFKFTAPQQKLILKLMKTIAARADTEQFLKIWKQ
ncbi:MAG: DUF5662 family protein [Proteobacteria bacterium]|nr:DUF5662 family protein [Pseudomonadota bacterium]